MPIEVVVPRLGWSMDEGTFGQWLKRDGERVERGQALFVLEGEKSAQDIESFDEGTLRIPPDAPQSGDVVKVGQVLAFLVQQGEPAPFESDHTAAPSSTRSPGRETASAGEGAVENSHSTIPASVRVGAKATPRARRLAAQLGIDCATVSGSGRAGRVRERDIASTARAGAKPQASVTRDREHADSESARVKTARAPLAVSRLRQTIASRMSASLHETAPVTLTTRCDATNLVALREQFKNARRGPDDLVPGYGDLIVKLAALTIEHHLLVAAQWKEGAVVLTEELHIALAVDTEAGLLAPVIHHADRLSLREIAAESRRLTERARSGKLSADEMQGGVFTITNLGMFGIDAFTPIINLPQSAILGVGRIAREPAVVGEQIVPREQITLSLTFDHRVLDGAPAARFLQELCERIVNPAPSLVA